MIVSKYLLRSATRRIHLLRFCLYFTFSNGSTSSFTVNLECAVRRVEKCIRSIGMSNSKFTTSKLFEEVYLEHYTKISFHSPSFWHIMLRLKCLWSLNNLKTQRVVGKTINSLPRRVRQVEFNQFSLLQLRLLQGERGRREFHDNQSLNTSKSDQLWGMGRGGEILKPWLHFARRKNIFVFVVETTKTPWKDFLLLPSPPFCLSCYHREIMEL